MLKLQNLERCDIRDAMSWIEIPELGRQARFLVKPATEANTPYYNAMLKLSGKRVRTMVKSDEITAEDAAQNRDDDAVLYPDFVITNFEGIEAEVPADAPDDQRFVSYSKANCRRVIAQLVECAPHLFDRIRNHAATPERFYGDQPDPENLAGNSESDSDSN